MNSSRSSESFQETYDSTIAYDPTIAIYSLSNLTYTSENWTDYDEDTQRQICATLCELADDDENPHIFQEIMLNLAFIAYEASRTQFIRETSGNFSKNVFQAYLDKHDRSTFDAFLSQYPISNQSTAERSKSILRRSVAVREGRLVLSPASQKLLSCIKSLAPDDDCASKFPKQVMLALIVPVIISDIEDSVKLPEMAPIYAGLHQDLQEWRNDLPGLFTQYCKRLIAHHRNAAELVLEILTNQQDTIVQFNQLTRLYDNALKAPQSYKVTGKFMGSLSFALITLANNLNLNLGPQLAVFMDDNICNGFMEANMQESTENTSEALSASGEHDLSNVTLKRGSTFSGNSINELEFQHQTGDALSAGT